MRLLRCLLLFVLPSLAHADAIDEFVRGYLARSKTPGLALGILRKDQPPDLRGYGLANVELNVPVSERTMFQSGSVGKQFTATAVVLLERDGRLSLEAPVSKYLGDVPKAWAPITVRHLLEHTSGLPSYDAIVDLRQDYTEEELLRMAKELEPSFEPGTRWEYSNTGYMLLGIVIHKAGGRFYGDVLRDRVFRPLGMKTARILSERDLVPDRAAGYELERGELKNQEWVSPTLNTCADGAIYLSLLDMAAWDAGLRGEKLLPKSELERMWTSGRTSDGEPTGYGFGWEVNEENGHRLIEHGGAWQGFTSHIARYVDDGLTIVVFANLDEADPGEVAHAVAALLNPELR